MFGHIILVIYVFSYQTELVKSADELEFWNPLSKHDGRRTLEPKKHYHHPNQGVEKFRYNKGKMKSKYKDDQDTEFKAKEKKLRPINDVHLRSHTHKSQQEDGTREEITSKWPKVYQHRYKTRDSTGSIRSTRMTPVYLMQQPEDNPDQTTTAPKKSKNDEFEDKYDNLSPYSIKKQMMGMASRFPEANITIEVIGRTIEYNDIVMMKVTQKKSDVGKYFRAGESKYVEEIPEKKIILIVHGLSVMGIDFIPCLSHEEQFETLLSYYFAQLDKFDIFLIPMANPDGFSMKNRIWNKNMSPQGACPGVSLDRNFDVAWNGTSGSSCSQHFPGLSPFSEPETRAIRDVIHRYSQRIIAYFNVHSGSFSLYTFKGDAVLYPKGYTDVQTDDDRYIDLRGDIEEAMRNASFQILSVTVDTLHNWYGKVAGTSVDYASTVYGIPFAMEFVMQPYLDEAEAESDDQFYTMQALKLIWKRVIDVIYENIWEYIKNGDQ